VNELRGIYVENNPLKLVERIGTILFAEYPTTIIFSDENREPIIQEWVDCSDDNLIDRYFYYQTDRLSLKHFFEGKLSHLDLINSSLDGYVVFQDFQGEKGSQCQLVSLRLIPSDYKPKANFIFDSKDGVDIEDIYTYFSLNNIDTDQTVTSSVKDISVKNNAETLYVKLKKGKGVGHGKINTETFGKTLLGFNKLYKNIALDYKLGNVRGEIDMDAKKNEQYLSYTQTELFENRIAASYGFLIKPVIMAQSNLFDNHTETQQIITRAFNLLNNTKDIETLKKEYVLHSGYTISSFKQFLEVILKIQLDINLNWFNPVNNQEMNTKMDYHKANRIIMDIESLATTDKKTFPVKGKFRAVHCDTRHYNFVELNDQPYSGYFDKLLKDGLTQVNFIDIYEVTIERRVTMGLDKSEGAILDTIMAYYKE
jgi:hypothetical protein